MHQKTFIIPTDAHYWVGCSLSVFFIEFPHWSFLRHSEGQWLFIFDSDDNNVIQLCTS